MNEKLAPHISGIIFAAIFGFSFLIVKSTLDSVHVFQLLGLRFLVAVFVMELLRLAKVIHIRLKKKDIITILPIAVFQPVLYFVSEVFGIKNSTSGEAGMMIGLIPVAVAVASWLMLKEKMNRKQLIFMGLSISGVLLISLFRADALDGGGNPLGYILLLGAVISAAFYNVISRKVSLTHKPIEITYIMMIVGALVFNVIGLIDSALTGYRYFEPFLYIESIMAILYLGILSSVLAFFLVNFTLSRISATQSSLYANLVTVISIIAGVIFLNEDFSFFKIFGSVLIIIGVFGTSYFQKPRQRINRKMAIPAK